MSWTEFAVEVGAAARKHPGHGCRICKLLLEVSPEEAKVIRSVLDDQSRSSASIHRAFKARGVALAKELVSKHRKGDCSL